MAIRPPGQGFSVARRMSERARAQRAAQEPPPQDAPGIGGIFDALRGLAEQFAKVTKDAGHALELGGERTKMVFGYTVRMGEHGIESEPFGNVPADAAARSAPQPAAALQPITEVFADGDAIVVVAELPGADPETITCRAEGASLTIEAAGRRSYRKTLTLPAPADPDGIARSYRNGILEVRMTKAEP